MLILLVLTSMTIKTDMNNYRNHPWKSRILRKCIEPQQINLDEYIHYTHFSHFRDEKCLPKSQERGEAYQ